ncbi:uncharacterized protein DS421_8g246560 [Arachis hypogaea]|nr:uncharacterized protein DS421_8g246560 [Arachis hypogaea]
MRALWYGTRLKPNPSMRRKEKGRLDGDQAGGPSHMQVDVSVAEVEWVEDKSQDGVVKGERMTDILMVGVTDNLEVEEVAQLPGTFL